MSWIIVLTQFVGLLVLPVVAGTLLGVARAKRVALTSPTCAACGSRLPFAAAAADAPCPGCNKPVSEAGPPRAERARRRWGLVLLGWLLFLVGWAGAFLGTQVAIWSVTGGVMTQSRSPAAAISAALTRNQGIQFELESLREHEQNGEDVVALAQSQLDAAIGTGDPTTSPPTIIASTTSSGPIDVASIALLGLPGGNPRPANDPVRAVRVLLACFPALELDESGLSSTPLWLRPRYTGFIPPHGPLQRIAIVKRVLVDGVEFSTLSPQSDGPDIPRILSSERPLQLAERPAPTAKTITLEVEVRLYSQFDARRITDHRGYLRPLNEWPEPLGSVRQTISSSLQPTAENATP
ncbi:MAG: hypothetical protein JNL80_10365 [Phycisphaerae bacterium]|jgi:hypothetical protein|nr:hypothetical protein [Phycisphaerae bacterium]